MARVAAYWEGTRRIGHRGGQGAHFRTRPVMTTTRSTRVSNAPSYLCVDSSSSHRTCSTAAKMGKSSRSYGFREVLLLLLLRRALAASHTARHSDQGPAPGSAHLCGGAAARRARAGTTRCAGASRCRAARACGASRTQRRARPLRARAAGTGALGRPERVQSSGTSGLAAAPGLRLPAHPGLALIRVPPRLGCSAEEQGGQVAAAGRCHGA